ncbi:MAG: hypothetical protein VBE63_11510 [Lamprobacter sp.]|uniref:hypothetical protein n=1 Tax=Lamprobacter sp. TaxID=3100796 RepID=UPI002B25B759|nr:hypothetical protein [Lamprobacter sp.]MEA3640556.1 hypothetical protein [Lamprobacter sp.]
MIERRYKLIFSGRLRGGITPGQAKQAIKERFRLSHTQLDQLFSGQPITVKRSLDQANAERYQRAFAAAGALVDIEPTSSGEDQDVHAGAENQAMQLLPAGTLIDEQVPPPQAPPDTSHLQLAPSEATSLEDCAPPPPVPPKLDLSALELAPIEPPQQEALTTRHDH